VIIVVITSISALLVISIVIVLLNVKRKKKQPRESVEGECLSFCIGTTTVHEVKKDYENN